MVKSKHGGSMRAASVRCMTYIDLSNNPGYMEEYMGAMFLPHTDEVAETISPVGLRLLA